MFFDNSGAPLVKTSPKGIIRVPGSRSLEQMLNCKDRDFVAFLKKCLAWKSDQRITPEEALKHNFITLNNMKLNSKEPSHKMLQKAIQEEDEITPVVLIKSNSKEKSLIKNSGVPNKVIAHQNNKNAVQSPKSNIKLHLNSFLKLKNPQPQITKAVAKPQISFLQISSQLQKQTKDCKIAPSSEKKEKPSEKKTLLLHVLAKKTIPVKTPSFKKS